MAYALSRILHNPIQSREQENAVFDSSICLIADILEHNSTKFSRKRFYADIYGVDMALELLSKENEGKKSYSSIID
jgi:hypothetical protein